MKIAIFSSADGNHTKENIDLAEKIGKYLAEEGVSVITGGCTGLPSIEAKSAFNHGAETIAYYPDLSERELFMNKQAHNNDIENIYSLKKFFKGFCYRSVRMIEDADGAIVFNGRFGTLSEFTVAVEEGLYIAVVEGTGGVTDEIKKLAEIVYKQFPYSNVVFSKDYKTAIDKLIENIKARKLT